jgi:hypothetical protein
MVDEHANRHYKESHVLILIVVLESVNTQARNRVQNKLQECQSETERFDNFAYTFLLCYTILQFKYTHLFFYC